MSETAELGTEAAVDTGTAEGLGVESIGEPNATSDLGADIGNVDAPPAGDFYKVTVGGQEQEVTLEDLRSGYMRQADYTRKTQEVAEMRQRLAQAEAIASALDADPQGTLQALAEAFGVPVGNQDVGGYEADDDVDPVEARLRGIEAQFQAQRAAEVRTQIDREIDTLVNTYGDFDITPVIAHAAQHGMTVTDAYRVLQFDSIAQKQRELEQMRNVKRDAAVVEGGAHRSGVVPGSAKPAQSIREAWAMAKQSVGA